jgi:hypothetical protein
LSGCRKKIEPAVSHGEGGDDVNGDGCRVWMQCDDNELWLLFVCCKANSASGMAVSDECKLKFQELKAKRSFRFITFKINEQTQQVVVDRLGQPGDTYADFTGTMPEGECRYAVFDFDFVTDENCQKSKIFFISWYADFTATIPPLFVLFFLPLDK